MKIVGNYQIINKIGICGKRSVQYQVTPVKSSNKKELLIATMHVLSHQESALISRGHLPPFLNIEQESITDLFFFAKHQKKYMVTITDLSKKRVHRQSERIISFKECLALFREACALIKELEWLGIRVCEPLNHFIQIDLCGQQEGSKDRFRISMLKISRGTQLNCKSIFLQMRNEHYSEVIHHKIALLKQFLNYLIKKTQKSRNLPLKIKQIWNILEKAQPEGQFIDTKIRQVLAQLSLCRKKTKVFSKLSLNASKLDLRIVNTETAQQKFYNKRAYLQADLTSTIRADGLFSLLATQPKDSFATSSTKNVKTISLRDFSLQKQVQVMEEGKSSFFEDYSKSGSTREQNIKNNSHLCSMVDNQGQGYPINCVVRVYAKFYNQKSQFIISGSGVFLSKNLVLTTAHLLSRHLLEVTVIVGRKVYKVDSYKYPQQFMKYSQRKANNFCLLHLSEPIQQDKQFSKMVTVEYPQLVGSLTHTVLANKQTNNSSTQSCPLREGPYKSIQNEHFNQRWAALLQKLLTFALTLHQDICQCEEDHMKTQKEDLVHYINLWKKDCHLSTDTISLLGELDSLLDLLKKGSITVGDVWQEMAKILRKRMKNRDERFGGMGWENITVSLKLLLWEPLYQTELIFLQKVETFKNLTLFTKSDLTSSNTASKSMQMTSLFKGYKPLLQRHIPHSEPLFPDNNASPFSFFKCNGYYRIGESRYYQYEYSVNLHDQALLLDVNWHCLKLVNRSFPLLLPTQIRDSDSWSLRITFRTFLTYSFLDFVSYAKDNQNAQTSNLILFIMKSITQKMADLHSSGQYLCAPIQYTLLLSPLDSELLFCHASTPESLYSFIKIKSTTTERKHSELLHSFYPVDQILRSKGDPVHFQSIDSWMLSQSFDRLMSATNFQGYNQPGAKCKLKLLMMQMRFVPPYRLTITKLNQILKKVEKTQQKK